MRFAFLQTEIQNTGGVRGINKNISILKEFGHDVDVYVANPGVIGCEEWNHPILTHRQRLAEDSTSELQNRDFSKYDLIVSAGLASMFEAELISHPRKVHFLQQYDKFICPQFNPIIDRLYHEATFIIHNDALKDILYKKQHVCDTVKIPYGIDFQKFHQYKNLNKNFSQPILCYMTSFFNVLKDMPLMQAVFEEITKAGWKTRLIAPQEPPPNWNYDEFCENPEFPEKCRLVAESAIMLHSSKFETWGRVIAECMCLGTPVVGVDSRGHNEYTTDANSWLQKNRDPKEVAENIVTLFDDKIRYYQMIDNAFDTMRRLDWSLIAEDIEQTYVNLC